MIRLLSTAALLVMLVLPSAAQEERKKSDLNARYKAVFGKVDAYEKDLTWDERTRDDRLALAHLELDKVRALVRNASRYLSEDYVHGQLDLALGHVEKHAAALGRPLTEHATPGRHELAYLSPMDLSPEPMQVYVPTSYDPKKPTPLWIFLHGYDAMLTKSNWLETMYSPEMEAQAEKQGVIVCLPYARSNTEFMGVGETEVMNSIAWMKRHYNIDDRRVIMSGASMGGSGAYSIATHYPDQFCGLMGITGRYDYYLWAAIEPEALPGFKRVMADTDYVQVAIDNLRHVPVLLFQGSGDTRPFPLPKHSRQMVRRLKGMGYSAQLVEFPAGHYIWGPSFSSDQLAAWMPGLKAPAAPKSVTFGTYTLKYNKAYWVTIDLFERWGERATVDAHITGPSEISATTRNVERLSLRPGKLIDASKNVTLLINGRRVVLKPSADGTLYLGADKLYPPLLKTPTLCGPVRDAYRSRFLIVAGTQGDAAQKDAAGKHAIGLAREWLSFTQGRVHMAADADVTEEQTRECNLILTGGPESNSILAKIADKLPIGIEKDAYVVGKKRVPRNADTGLLMVYPNPLNTDRYVVIADGLPWGRNLDVNHKLDLVPDFIIFGREPSANVTTEPLYLNPIVQTNAHIVAGFFSKTWTLSDRLTWWANED